MKYISCDPNFLLLVLVMDHRSLNLKQDKTLALVSLERGQRLTGTGIRQDSFPSIRMHFDGVYCSSSSWL